jgi:uncharacterized protein YndB with AHSA1/START domain
MTRDKGEGAESHRDRQLVITRVVDAPRDLVFRAFTEPAHVAQWWGPFGFKNTIHEMAVRPGGVWRLTMHGPDGTDYPNEIHFHHVVAPERLAFRHGSGIPGEPDFEVEVTFAEEGGGTRVTLRQTHLSAARAAEVGKYAIEGGNQTLTRLQGYLGTMRECVSAAVLEGVVPDSGEDDFVLTRVLAAPRDLVFRVMTEPEHLSRWFGPAGMGLSVVSSELWPGGQLRYAMNPGPARMHGRFVYREVVPPARLAYVVSFTDDHFTPVRHPMSKTWPLEVLAINTLTELGGKTLLFGRSIPIHAAEADRETFRGGHRSMVEGFRGTFDQLDDYLRTMTPRE